MNILSLSNEVIHQVFDNLDCLDILAARSTCGRLYSIGKTRLLWESKVLEVSYSSGIPVLESPMEDYTSEELEERLLKRARTRQKWHNLDPPNFRWESIGEDYYPPYEATREYKWFPGGRWLLFHVSRCVYVEDLDRRAQERSECVLDLSKLGYLSLLSNVWIDPTKYWLSEARVAVRCDEGALSVGIICILQIKLTRQGSNIKPKLGVYTAIRRQFQSYVTGVHLEKEYVLATCGKGMRSGSQFRAYLYKYSNDGQCRSYNWDCDKEAEVSLLPGGRVCTITPERIEISVISPVRTSHLELQPVLCTPLDPISGSFRIFDPHSTPRFSYLNIVFEDTLLEIRIPVDANEVYQKQITFARGSLSEKWGPSLLVRMPDEWSMEFISYELNDSATGQVVSHYSTMEKNVFRKRPRLREFDVTAGRMMIWEGGEYLLIWI